MKKILSTLLALTMLLVTLAGCSSADKPSTQQTSGAAEKVLNFGCQMYTDGIVNSVMDENGGWNAMRYGIAETLFKFNDSMEVEPWLAESYSVNDAHTEWVITLKEGIYFSDGCPLTPSRVKATFDYLKTMGPSGSAKPQKYLEYEAEVTADDAANTITIVTSQPYANLMGQLCHPTMGIIDVEHTTDFDNGVIGTGPYMIEKFNGVGVGYDMVKNPNYREPVPYDRVKILFMGDASAKTMALQSGQVDLVENITNVADIQKFKEDPNFTVDIASGVRCGFSWMNFNGILANKTLRQAILMGIDYDTICASKTIGGLYTPGFSVLPSTLSYGYENLVNPYPYNPEKAKEIMDAAGIVDTDGDGIRELDGKNINLRYVSYENRLLNDFSDAHIQYLAEIGIGCTTDYGSSDDQWSKLAAGEYDLNNNNWTTVGTGDPLAFMANWATESTYCSYSNPEYDALFSELKGEMDPEKRAELVFRMQQILIDDAAVLIDGYYNSSMIYSKNVGNAHIHTADYYWLTTEITPAN
ncbi:MAG: ABC transporter substrate-binding protein [Clostridiales bacterium]|nr:ABC transporter substrate-binding protein [Clostridiales bacterium]